MLQGIPWTDVMSNAPTVVDGARKLWAVVSRRRKPAGLLPSSLEVSTVQLEAIGSVELAPRVLQLEVTVLSLQEEMETSTGIIKQLAEQNANLISALDRSRAELQAELQASANSVQLLGEQVAQANQRITQNSTKTGRLIKGFVALAATTFVCLFWLVTQR